MKEKGEITRAEDQRFPGQYPAKQMECEQLSMQFNQDNTSPTVVG